MTSKEEVDYSSYLSLPHADISVSSQKNMSANILNQVSVNIA